MERRPALVVARRPPTSVTLGTVDLAAGDHEFSAEIAGSNPAAAPRHMLGLDCLRLVPAQP